MTPNFTALIADDSSLIRERLFELLSAIDGIDSIEQAIPYMVYSGVLLSAAQGTQAQEPEKDLRL